MIELVSELLIVWIDGERDREKGREGRAPGE